MRVGNRVKHIFTTLPFTNNQRPSRSSPSSGWKEKGTNTNPNTTTTTTLTTDKYHNAVHISENGNPSDDVDSLDGSRNNSNRPRTVRIISWQLDDMTRTQTQTQTAGGCRWTLEQERELRLAQQELARCQKAWSSEQEVWLKHINTLNIEKEAHEDFLHLRAKQQADERAHFRKSWGRRRSSEGEPTEESGDDGGERLRWSRSQKFRRLRRGS